HARRIRHVLVDHFADTERSMFGSEAKFDSDPLGDGVLGSIGIEPHLAAGEGRRVDTSEYEIGIGHGRLAAAAAVTDWPRFRAGALRADINAPKRVDRSDRSAAGPDLDHFDNRDAQRQSAAFGETIDSRHLEGARCLRTALVDKTDFRGRAAHIERHDLIETMLAGNAGGKDR